jgi:hypothetical protein
MSLTLYAVIIGAIEFVQSSSPCFDLHFLPNLSGRLAADILGRDGTPARQCASELEIQFVARPFSFSVFLPNNSRHLISLCISF